MTLGPIRISEIMRQGSPGSCHFHQTGALYDRIANQSRASQNQNAGTAHDFLLRRVMLRAIEGIFSIIACA
jgi:hypothetical protein